MRLLFELSGLLVLPFWVLMLFLPGWRRTERLMRSPRAAAGPAVLYALLVLPHFVEHAPVLVRPELDRIAALLGSPAGATISWAHFLSFDLFVGRWIYLDARRRSVSAWLMAPVLFLTLLFGPIGFLLHLCIRRLYRRAEPAESGPGPALTF